MTALFSENCRENYANNRSYHYNHATNYRKHNKDRKKMILSLFDLIILIAFLSSFLKRVLVIL